MTSSGASLTHAAVTTAAQRLAADPDLARAYRRQGFSNTHVLLDGRKHDLATLWNLAAELAGLEKRQPTQAVMRRELESLGFDVHAAPPWSAEEVRLVVADYLSMLDKETRGVAYNKRAHNQALRPRLNDRNHGAIEMKHANISKVLEDMGRPYIKGYKPRGNIQAALRDEVAAQLDAPIPAPALPADDVPAPHHAPTPVRPETADTYAVEVPAPSLAMPEERTRTFTATKTDHAEREARAREVGEAGECWVLKQERERLRQEGRDDLAARVVWVSKEKGDGAGYDILSFETNGRKLFIEVKTTVNRTADEPIFLSENEVAFSRKCDNYCIYRVYDFENDPKHFVLPGPISPDFLRPTQYALHFQKTG